MQRNHRMLLDLLREDRYLTARQLARMLDVNEKTVRNRIGELSGVLEKNGGQVVGKQKLGYQLKITDRERFSLFLQQEKENKTKTLPTTNDERVAFLTEALITGERYLKLEDLSEQLYVSRNVVAGDLQKAEAVLRAYGIELCRRPNYGVCAVGDEFSRRVCLVNAVLKADPAAMHGSGCADDGGLAQVVRTVMAESGASMSDVSFRNFLLHIQVSMTRIRMGACIQCSRETILDEIGERPFAIAQSLARELERHYGISLEEGEVSNLAIHLAGKLTNYDRQGGGPHRISQETEALSEQIIRSIDNAFGYAFYNDLDLRLRLGQHLGPMAVRLKYGIPLENPMLQELKKEYPLAYAMAAHASAILSQRFGTAVAEDETGYLLLIFQYALEGSGRDIEKKNIAIICASGQGTAHLFHQRFRQIYGRYIDHIYECSAYELANFDFTKIDYLFSTIKLDMEVPVPVIEVPPFLERPDEEVVRTISERKNRPGFFDHFFTPKLFFTDLRASTKTEVLREMCQRIAQVVPLPENFCSLVLQREEFGGTELGPMAAIPHPYVRSSKDFFVAVAVLPRPVWWGKSNVRVVFLLSVSSEGGDDLQQFFKALADLAFDKQAIRQLLAHPDHATLLELLRQTC